MAVSGSTDFARSAAELVQDARELLGIHADEEPMPAHELQRGLRSLTRMLKTWQADRVYVPLQTEGTLSLTQGKVEYTFGSGGDFTTVPFEITQMRIDRSGSEIEMFQMGREEYFRLPNKTTEGYPTQWYYHRQRSGGTLYVWPAPDATAGTVKFTYERIVNDMDASADDLDLPQEWIEPVTYNLAKQFIPLYGKANSPNAAFVIGEAVRLYNLVSGFNTAVGKSSLEIYPDHISR